MLYSYHKLAANVAALVSFVPKAVCLEVMAHHPRRIVSFDCKSANLAGTLSLHVLAPIKSHYFNTITCWDMAIQMGGLTSTVKSSQVVFVVTILFAAIMTCCGNVCSPALLDSCRLAVLS